MRALGNSLLVLFLCVALSQSVMGQQDSIATGWAKTLGITTHGTTAVPAAHQDTVLVSDEVSAGWDFDRDGNKEFLVLTDHSNPNGGGPEKTTGASLYLYEGSSSGYELVWSWFDETLHTGGASFPTQAVGDLDGDGNLEVLLGIPFGEGYPASGANQARFYVFEETATGLPDEPDATWTFDVTAQSNTRPAGMSTGDFDGDGDQEVVVGFRNFSDAVTDDAVMIFSLDGAFAGEFTSWKKEVVDTTSNFGTNYWATTTDIDGDGMKEAFVSSYSYDEGHFWEGTGTADTYDHVVIPGDKAWLSSIHCGSSWDVDGDGTEELLLANVQGSGALVIITGVTDLATADTQHVHEVFGHWPNEDNTPRGQVVGDFDQDGNTDIFISGSWQKSVFHWEYDGTGDITDSASWIANGIIYQQAADSTSREDRVYQVAFGSAANNGGTSADLDGNSHPDLVIAYESGDTTATDYVVVIEETGSVVTAIEGDFGAPLLKSYSLSQNYPNPFNPTTTLSFDLSVGGYVELAVYDLIGRKLATLVSKEMPAGNFVATWDGIDASGTPVASGVYIAQLQINGVKLTRQMTLLK
ncbi:MAG: T9SS type A sorting domain-containing protein [Fidelibacterota bacterium]|nr:MAG: T9SS type A sorting domain-containing protein [Candidatus Neomarinimicrobiota bacterium]